MSNPFAEIPPPLPPKHSAPSRRQQQHQSLPPTRPSIRNDSSHAHHSSRSADTPSRTRPNRSQTTGPPATSSGSRPQPTQPRRSHSSDSTPSDKTKHPRSKSKKGSMHADVIDRLDFTGVGPMFHHDGPFDACAPSRNRQRTKAPMYAWTSINPEDEEVAARYRDDQDGPNPVAPTLAYNHSYPSELPRSPPAAANYSTYYSEPPKKKVDAIAEAWGIHEPEPYEEFFAGGGDFDSPITNGNTVKEARSNGRRTREDVTSRPRGANRIPPPQPIFVRNQPSPEAYPAQPSPGSGGANLGRNKSIIQRIRRMRDSPNVPVGFDESIDTGADGVPSPTSSTESSSHGRQAHRRGDSFLGRFTRGRGDTSPASPVEPYIYVDDRTKELPPTPVSSANRYSDGPSSPGAGLGRTTSILKKVRGVVRGSK